MVPLPLSCDSRPIACIHLPSLCSFCPCLTGSISCSCHSYSTTLIFSLRQMRVTVHETALTSVFFTLLCHWPRSWLLQSYICTGSFMSRLLFVSSFFFFYFFLLFSFFFWKKNFICMKTHSWCTNKKRALPTEQTLLFCL